MLLPSHPLPLPGEILSSWMVRLAYANGFKLHNFYSNLLGYKGQLWNRDIDRHPKPELLQLLSQKTGQPVEKLRSMTLQAYEGMLFEQLPEVGNASWILPLGIYHRKRNRPGMQFCPMCLRLSEKPHYRTVWRLAIYVVCECHQCIMHSHCDRCLSPVAFHRNGIGVRSSLRLDAMYACHQCHNDFRHAPVHYVDWPDESSFARLLEIFRYLDSRIEGVQAITVSNPLLFFTGLRVLINIVWGRYGGHVRAAIQQILNLVENLRRGRKGEFETQDIVTRVRMMLVLCWLIEDWPARFVCARGEHKLPLSYFKANRNWVPFWVEQGFGGPKWSSLHSTVSLSR